MGRGDVGEEVCHSERVMRPEWEMGRPARPGGARAIDGRGWQGRHHTTLSRNTFLERRESLYDVYRCLSLFWS